MNSANGLQGFGPVCGCGRRHPMGVYGCPSLTDNQLGEMALDLETERMIMGRNQHTVYRVCPTHGTSVYAPLENHCVDCRLYISGADVRLLIAEAVAKAKAS